MKDINSAFPCTLGSYNNYHICGDFGGKTTIADLSLRGAARDCAMVRRGNLVALLPSYGIASPLVPPTQPLLAMTSGFTKRIHDWLSPTIAIGLFTFLFIGCFSSAHAQVPGSPIDVQHYTFAIQLNDENNNIKGQATIGIKFLRDVADFEIDLVKKRGEKGMLVSSVTANGKDLRFVQDSDDVKIYADEKANSTHDISIAYAGIPADGLIISTNKFGHRTFFGDNWPNRAHNWLPCVDGPADKASLDFFVTAPAHYQVVANGLKAAEQTLPNGLKLTHWKETALLPPKVMVIGVAEFAIDDVGSPDGIPVYSYVFPENKEVGFKSYAVAKDILPFYISKFGPYAYPKLANVQSKTIFGGMENAGAIFYFENSVGDKGIEELMAHEIAHQWFGDAASEKSWQNLWLSEGFATYMTDYYLENKYGADTLKKRLINQRRTVLSFERSRLTPVVDSTVKSNYMVLLNANSYEKGGWVLHMLRRKLGDDLFWKGIRAYYEKYDGGNANTADLRMVMEKVSGQNLQTFFKQWLLTAGHPQLNITWKYDAAKKTVAVQVEQAQSMLYDLPLELAIGGQKHTVLIKNKTTTVQFPAAVAPITVTADPDVNLLASFTVNNGNF